MPLYDYKCTKCNHIFEVMQKISEEPLKFCPRCKGHIKRLISPAGIIFKGSGFHVTDYRPKTKDLSAEARRAKEDQRSKTKETKSSSEAASPKKSE